MNVESISLSAVVQSLVVVAIIWIAKATLKNSDARIRHDALLSRLESDRRELNDRVYSLANSIHGAMGKQELQAMRMDRDDAALAEAKRRGVPDLIGERHP